MQKLTRWAPCCATSSSPYVYVGAREQYAADDDDHGKMNARVL